MRHWIEINRAPGLTPSGLRLGGSANAGRKAASTLTTLEGWGEMWGEARKPRNRRPMRFPAATLDILPLRPNMFFKRSANVACREAVYTTEQASSKYYNRFTGNAAKSGRVNVFAIESIGKQASPVRRLTTT